MVNGGCIGFYVPILHGFKAGKVFLKCRRADEFDGGRRELGMTATFLSFHHSRKREEKKVFRIIMLI